MTTEQKARLQVLVCTFGADGIRRVASSAHPRLDGVEYIVSWQQAGPTPLPESLRRPDFKVYATDSTGLARNRNHALTKATAPLLLLSDDDVAYTAEGLQRVIDAFDSHPDCDLLTFRYESASGTKHYPGSPFPLNAPPKGYFASSIEIAFRRREPGKTIWFNEHFGIGADFPSGEEDIFIRDCLDAGMKGMFVPATVARHDGATTSGRNLMLSSRPLTKGAVFLRLHPRSWFARMIAHALREIPLWRQRKAPSPLSFCANWIKGVNRARRLKAFPTAASASKPSGHEE